MHGTEIPWHENAVAVCRTTAGETSILFEGPLLTVVRALRHSHSGSLDRVRVSLPDRHTPPRVFEGAGLVALIDLSGEIAAT